MSGPRAGASIDYVDAKLIGMGKALPTAAPTSSEDARDVMDRTAASSRVGQKSVDRARRLVGIERLGHVSVESGVEHATAILLADIGGQRPSACLTESAVTTMAP